MVDTRPIDYYLKLGGRLSRASTARAALERDRKKKHRGKGNVWLRNFVRYVMRLCVYV